MALYCSNNMRSLLSANVYPYFLNLSSTRQISDSRQDPADVRGSFAYGLVEITHFLTVHRIFRILGCNCQYLPIASCLLPVDLSNTNLTFASIYLTYNGIE